MTAATIAANTTDWNLFRWRVPIVFDSLLSTFLRLITKPSSGRTRYTVFVFRFCFFLLRLDRFFVFDFDVGNVSSALHIRVSCNGRRKSFESINLTDKLPFNCFICVRWVLRRYWWDWIHMVVINCSFVAFLLTVSNNGRNGLFEAC